MLSPAALVAGLKRKRSSIRRHVVSSSEASPLDRVTRHPLTRPLASMVKRTSTSPPALARLASRG